MSMKPLKCTWDEREKRWKRVCLFVENGNKIRMSEDEEEARRSKKMTGEYWKKYV